MSALRPVRLTLLRPSPGAGPAIALLSWLVCWAPPGFIEPAAADEAPATRGCYARTYDADHMGAHKGQFVTKASVDILPPRPEQLDDPKWGIVSNATLRVWVKGHKAPFESFGACSARGGILECGGSVSAAEEDACKANTPGVHDCRVDSGDAGNFRIETRPQGIVVAVVGRLELVFAGSDTGPYLNLVASDAQNRDFLLHPAAQACR